MKVDRDRGILFGDTEIYLTCVEQLVNASQTRFTMDCLVGDSVVGQAVPQRPGYSSNTPPTPAVL